MTEELFAACLLACGPHVPNRIKGDQAINDYYTRIWKWYSNEFWSIPIHKGNTANWILFYNEYFNWVEEA